ncbi:MFS transporter [Novosphingobium sp. Gsoil 351]|uniref:MFS transporter n=1 Tax=Novosphingobium sp. Gsoil 351 TaxID=2675225 RepID=UPI0012B501E1|nr:MFS transporter [Novosphingobium sp. Gsoil 351]QGN55996.1 MFS transporter [Novosphingobium sp. Gsoil 351]
MRETTSEAGRSAMRKALWRIVPLIALAYLCAYTDRVNVGFAAAQMNADLGFSATVYGLGGGLFFLGYALFEVPSNLMAVRYGSRAWLARIMITWGLLSAAMMFVATPWQFYTVRFLLGVAEAGFYPGVIFYFSHWFPACHRGRAVSRFYVASPLSSVLLGGVSGWLLALDGRSGLEGWQWLFLVQGLPSVFVGLLVWRYLPERPAEVAWLSDAEKSWIDGELAREQARIGDPRHHGVLAAMRNPRVLQLGGLGLLLIGSITTLVLNAPLVLTAATGWSTGEAGWIVSLGGLLGAATIIWAGNSADRRNSRFPDALVYSALLTLALLVLAFSPSPAVTIAAYMLFAVACFTIPMLTSSGWAELLSARELAVGAAAINTLSQIGAFVTPFAWGVLKDASGDFRAGLLLLTGLALGLTLMLWQLCRQLRRGLATALPA